MILTATKRILVSGAKNFYRGGAVSVATVLIMTVTLAVIGFLIFISALLTHTLTTIKNKVDVTIYFTTTAKEADIFVIKERLEQLPQVARTTYTSAEDELVAFRARHANDQLILQSLDQLDSNPLNPSLEIRAHDPSQYESIIEFIESSPALTVSGMSIIDRINYEQNKEAIDRLVFLIRATRDIGSVIVALFAIASILIAFATIRLAIYTAKDEIAVMRLVGASNAYVQGPFVVTGMITGTIAALIVLLLLWPATVYISSKTETWFDGWSMANYYFEHLGLIVLIILASGILLGAVASVFAIRKYLRV